MQNEEGKKKITRKDEKLKSAGALKNHNLAKTRKDKKVRRCKNSSKAKASNSNIWFNNSSNTYSSIARKPI